ncbi:MAG: hypothetical protein WA019_06715 [Candidatus Moraniibacteriota bacterium]
MDKSLLIIIFIAVIIIVSSGFKRESETEKQPILIDQKKIPELDHTPK